VFNNSSIYRDNWPSSCSADHHHTKDGIAAADQRLMMFVTQCTPSIPTSFTTKCFDVLTLSTAIAIYTNLKQKNNSKNICQSLFVYKDE